MKPFKCIPKSTIKSVEFVPRTCFDRFVKRTKRHSFFGIQLGKEFTYYAIASSNIKDDSRWHHCLTLDKAKQEFQDGQGYQSDLLVDEQGFMYTKPRVVIGTKQERFYRYFDTDKEATDFIKELNITHLTKI